MDSNSYWSRRISRRATIRGSALGLAGLAGAALVGCGGGGEKSPTTTGGGGALATATAVSQQQAKRGGTFRVSITADPTTLDPYKTASSPARTFTSYFYSRLLRYETKPNVDIYDQAITGDLAESIETTDGQNWVLKLRKGVKFHNIAPVSGREFTSADVKYNWDRLTDAKSIARSSVQNVTSATFPDAYTVKFVLKEPSAIFPHVLADFLNIQVMPLEADGKFNPLVTPIGTGPFIMEQYQTSSKAKFRRNPDYYVTGVPYVDSVETLIIPEYANARAQLESGGIHTLAVQPDDLLGIRKNHTDWQWKAVGGTVGYLYWSAASQSPGAPWLDERYRQAVSMAMDREGQHELAYNVGTLKQAGLEVVTDTNNIVPRSRGTWWLDPSNPGKGDTGRFFKYNLAEAKKLLSAGGWEGTPIKFQYPTTQYGPVYQLIVQSINDDMNKLGIKAQLEGQDYNSVYFPQTRAGKFHGVSLGAAASYAEVNGYVDRFFSHTESNASMIRDKDLDDLRAKQAAELDVNRRRELIHDIQRINAQHMYYCPTNYGAGLTYTAYLPSVRNISNPRGPIQSETYPYLWLE